MIRRLGRRTLTIAALLLALLVGVGIGSTGKTTVHTKTTTVDSTRTVTSTRTLSKSVTPAACKRAIKDAQLIGVIAGDGFKTASQWPALLSRVVTAVEDQSVSQVDAIVAKEKVLNRAMTNDVPLATAAVAQFDKDAAGCK